MNKLPANYCNGAINEDLLKNLAHNEKMAELGRISAGVVHELNAPLSVIISASQMIMREQDVSEFVLEMVARISAEAQRLSQMTRGLLNFSSHDDTLSEVDINLTISFVLDFLGFEAARRGINISRQLDFQLPVLFIDGNKLKQILLNLVMNALQAMEPGGGDLLVKSISTCLDEIDIVISDTGSGIPEENLPKIFQPYFTTKKPGEGTGLGLFVTKTLVENLGGRIKVASTAGKGTTFTVTLMVNEPDGEAGDKG
jgi:signal transduction histidine kinase